MQNSSLIREADAAAIVSELLARVQKAPKPSPVEALDQDPRPQEGAFAGSDAELLAVARRAANGGKVVALHDDADLTAYNGDASAGEMALASLLAFYTGDDPERLDQLMRGSALLQHPARLDKWETQHYANGETYGQHTIREAIALHNGRFYSAQKPGQADAPAAPLVKLSDWKSTNAFVGTPPQRSYLVDGIFPKGQVSLLAASGGVGKSFSLLSLARDVAGGEALRLDPPKHFGGELRASGIAVYLSAEDDATELHSRLEALGGPVENLFAVPLPSAGGAPLLFRMDAATRAPAATPAWADLSEQLKALRPALVVLDPLQVFAALDLNLPENAQYVCSKVSALAATVGASVIISHHFRKTEASTPEEARQAIRGTAGLVDGVRAVYALWEMPEARVKGHGALAACRALGTPYERGKVVCGAVVKSNGCASTRVSTFLRDARGLLVDRSDELRRLGNDPAELKTRLASLIGEAAEQGRPYTKTGENGLYARKHELGEGFANVSKNKFTIMVDELLDAGGLTLALAKGSRAVKWLDLPSGPFAKGVGFFEPGSRQKTPTEEPDFSPEDF